MLMGVAATAALCGPASAAPPALSEGRELDPVARDFFLAGPATPAPGAESAPAKLPTLSFLGNIREVIITRFTVPLGTVRPAGGIR
jgi:hypothetical protein